MKKGKLLIISAPSGSGKSTLVKFLMNELTNLEFSISATSRKPRGNEKHKTDYYFLSVDDFKNKIAKKDFVEWEEVYKGRFYGTLKSEVNRIRESGKTVVFDVDVIGGLNIKKLYGDEALALFIKPPSIDELKNRLKKRGTDETDEIEKRIAKAEEEMSYAPKFDRIIINDDLNKAQKEILDAVKSFLK
ncbi:Guanylate kinase [Salinivirga cyanobacteriivorans]|uniref:Guanylate kinase n=1 Tax=Salinivirga cyanobacteriivorans TaxID=1307839 RepID=A0A0S2HW32_9BACT|nr:guanylate kinase [Salinivirga cyanobacteriivorans]ALO14263.1 Guanylate kinase [Salinivirga cyanobacteriivorans]